MPFDGVVPEEKNAYVADIKATGEFEGYKPLQYWVSVCSTIGAEYTSDMDNGSQHIDNGVRDRMEQYNCASIPRCPAAHSVICRDIFITNGAWVLVVNRNVHYKEHPQAIRPLLPEIQEFVRFNHEEVVHELER